MPIIDYSFLNIYNMSLDQVRILRVYELEPKLKHPTIFQWFEELAPAEAFVIENDHDPKPLYYQMLGELGSVFNWQYAEQGPEIWKVIIQRKAAGEPTVGDIAAKDMKKAEAMKKLGIDFCCGGGKTVAQAAAEAGIQREDLEKALEETSCSVNGPSLSFTSWDADFLADYIYNQHHKYFYNNSDTILQLVAKVRDVHRASHPELIQLSILVGKLFEELRAHFYKEEKMLFPYIKELAVYKREGTLPSGQITMTTGPLAMMLMEHESAGEILKAIRSVTNGYQVPDDACNSFRLLYQKLEELEADLHQHIHLENNILFPKAVKIERELAG